MAYISKNHTARRAINFDLNINALKENYSVTNPKGAYKEIRSFFEKNGFSHRQGSGYCSRNKLTDMELFEVMQKMFKTLPWLDVCSTKIDATDIGKVYDIKELLDTASIKETFHDKQKKNSHPVKKSVLQKLNSNRELINQNVQKAIHPRQKGEPNREER